MKRPRFWLVTLGAVLAAAGTLALGFWQWGRAQQKIALHAAIEAQQAAAPLDAKALLGRRDATPLVHRPIRLQGRWVPEHTVYLDNRQMEGRTGFYVVTPLRIEGSDAAVAVQRGWIPRNFEHREQLPPVQTPGGVVEVQGRLAPPPAKLYEFAGAGQGAIRQNLDLAALRDQSGLALLLAVSVQQLGPPSEGLLRHWPEAGSGAEKNYGYAFQWWALSALIAILYVWFQFVVPHRARPS
jgi:surfeit locus 1 family protein